MKRRNRMSEGQRGVGLIEVLIALLVLSFGMLGMAGLQVWSLKYNQSAMERGMAVVQTHTIADAMRADRPAALRDEFDIGLEAEPPSGNTFAEVSLRAWRASVQEALGPDATGSVECNGSRCDIRVRWNDTRATYRDTESDGDTGDVFQVVLTEVQL
jgi:type IV pilus assembly protein PilV